MDWLASFPFLTNSSCSLCILYIYSSLGICIFNSYKFGFLLVFGTLEAWVLAFLVIWSIIYSCLTKAACFDFPFCYFCCDPIYSLYFLFALPLMGFDFIHLNRVLAAGVKMNGIQSRKAQNINVDKQFPGCLGRMVNLFDMSTSVSGNRLLTDKPHYDGDYFSLCSIRLFPCIID